MLKVGLTGGIGSGKSTIAKLFTVLGVPVYTADEAAKTVIDTDPGVRKNIIELFGTDAFRDGVYNRKYISARVFNDETLLKKLNSIVHPATFHHFERWLHEQDSRYIIKEAAILFESGSNKTVDVVITVTAPVDLRIKRVANRDNSDPQEIKKRIASQLTDEERTRLSDHVIINDDRTPVLPQVLKLHSLFNQSL